MDEQEKTGSRRIDLVTLIRNLPGIVCRCRNDRDWTMEYVSEACFELTGYPPEALVGSRDLSFGDLIHPDDRDRVWAEVQAALGERRPFQVEYRIESRNGRTVHVWERGRGRYGPDGSVEAIEGLVLDVSERVQNREALLQQERELYRARRMEAVGQMAGGIAHDFNNLLTAILGFSRLALDDEELPDGLRDAIAEIHGAAGRAATLTRQLLNLARREEIEAEATDLNPVVRDLAGLLERLLRDDIEIRCTLDPDLWTVLVDPGRIEQVLLNLALNAQDAMPDGGRLTIETSNVDLDESRLETSNVDVDELRLGTTSGVAPGSYVVLTVRDTGIGMDELTREHAFEPFFTTKGEADGTGLGLSSVYRIVKQYGGHVWLYSEPGGGARFRIYFPRATAERPGEARAAVPARAEPGSETVLVVENNDLVRRYVKDALERLGYRVVAVESGREALRLALDENGEVDVVVTDYVLPDINGAELIARLRARGGLRAVCMSGYAAGTLSGDLGPDVAFVEKPFTASELSRAIRSVLGA